MTERVLPADVYDALELSAWVHGGIGACSWWDDSANCVPLCATGHRWFLQGDCDDTRTELANAFLNAEIHSGTNDAAVHRINGRSGNALNARVPFSKWCEELHVVRGV